MENNLANERNELWAIYSWWSCVLALKMFSLTWFTGRIRVDRQVIHSEEDRVWMKGSNTILCPTGGGHEDVDRIRSAHRHDLETVLPYLLITPIWLNTSPMFPVAKTIPRCFAILSISYTLMHMEIVNVPRYCKTILFALEVCILTCMSAMSAVYYSDGF
ncbi:prostaglandin E synthase-like [Osmia bicornis bicornis]|uniref:prostaglandin E synthase-like n=1 Tax=Osmia bicornis bicornis TaxID=1437191 RepID=UPI001EAEF244|nr:prostaglandin E synthase-like [Osmia bicornis bicornis]